MMEKIVEQYRDRYWYGYWYGYGYWNRYRDLNRQVPVKILVRILVQILVQVHVFLLCTWTLSHNNYHYNYNNICHFNNILQNTKTIDWHNYNIIIIDAIHDFACWSLRIYSWIQDVFPARLPSRKRSRVRTTSESPTPTNTKFVISAIKSPSQVGGYRLGCCCLEFYRYDLKLHMHILYICY